LPGDVFLRPGNAQDEKAYGVIRPQTPNIHNLSNDAKGADISNNESHHFKRFSHAHENYWEVAAHTTFHQEVSSPSRLALSSRMPKAYFSQLTSPDLNEAPTVPLDQDPAGNVVAENAATGSATGITVQASDPDGDTITYTLTDNAGGRFAIDPVTGVVTVADGSLLDYEAAASHQITILATSQGGLSASETLTINLADLNEAPTVPLDQDPAGNVVAENAATGSATGITVQASDPDGDTITYTLTDNAGGRFAIDPVTGVVTVDDGSLLDYEAATSHQITILATSHIFQQTINIVVHVAPSELALHNLASGSGYLINGEVSNGYFGAAISSAGDLNGDGLNDLIVGAYDSAATMVIGDYDSAVPSGSFSGTSYVIYGAHRNASLDLAHFTNADGFRIFGAHSGDFAGSSVAAAGDFNGDGRSDIIVGAYNAVSGGSSAPGQAYLLYGKDTAMPDIHLSAITAADGFHIIGAAAGDQTGWSVAGVGDVNGDGLDDIAISSVAANGPGGLTAGRVDIVYGHQGGGTDVNVSTLSISQGFTIYGGTARDLLGTQVTAAGDINGDGIDDIIIGTDATAQNALGHAGVVNIIYGKLGDRPNLDLSNPTDLSGLRIYGPSTADGSRYAVSNAGDVNGDGVDDIIIGMSSNDLPERQKAGTSYVVYGSARGLSYIDLSALDNTQGFAILGAQSSGKSGYSVSGGGDINGDGFADLVIGEPFDSSGATPFAGNSYVIYGNAQPRDALDLMSLDPHDGFRLSGTTSPELSGYAVSMVGDLDGDGYDDIAVGAILATSLGQSTSGEAYIVYGQDFLGTTTVQGSAQDDLLFAHAQADVIIGGLGNDQIFTNGGADIVHAGAGADIIHAANADLRLIDGGSGYDQLLIDFSGGIKLGSTASTGDQLHACRIEQLDMQNGKDNTLTLSLQDLFQLDSDTLNPEVLLGFAHTFTINGDATDSVMLEGGNWHLENDATPPGFTAYSAQNHLILVDNDVSVIG
jgi:hypothetical protein